MENDISPNLRRSKEVRDVINIMSRSVDLEDWVDNCNAVKNFYNGQYPPFWYQVIGEGKVAKETFKRFNNE